MMLSYSKGFVTYTESLDDPSTSSEYEWLQEYKEAQHRIELHIHSDSFLLSNDAINLLLQLEKEFSDSRRVGEQEHQARCDFDSTKRAISQMMMAAKRDLGIK